MLSIAACGIPWGGTECRGYILSDLTCLFADNRCGERYRGFKVTDEGYRENGLFYRAVYGEDGTLRGFCEATGEE